MLSAYDEHRTGSKYGRTSPRNTITAQQRCRSRAICQDAGFLSAPQMDRAHMPHVIFSSSNFNKINGLLHYPAAIYRLPVCCSLSISSFLPAPPMSFGRQMSGAKRDKPRSGQSTRFDAHRVNSIVSMVSTLVHYRRLSSIFDLDTFWTLLSVVDVSSTLGG